MDYGDVCVNIDDVWFANQGIAPPQTLADLTQPEYQDLFVTPGATTSSPGMSFLLATIGEFGPGEWQTYWQELMANGAKVTSGWTDAYTVDFTAGGSDGEVHDRDTRRHREPAVGDAHQIGVAQARAACSQGAGERVTGAGRVDHVDADRRHRGGRPPLGHDRT